MGLLLVKQGAAVISLDFGFSLSFICHNSGGIIALKGHI